MGIQQYVQAENKGQKVPTLEDYREEAIASGKEPKEVYGEEK